MSENPNEIDYETSGSFETYRYFESQKITNYDLLSGNEYITGFLERDIPEDGTTNLLLENGQNSGKYVVVYPYTIVEGKFLKQIFTNVEVNTYGTEIDVIQKRADEYNGNYSTAYKNSTVTTTATQTTAHPRTIVGGVIGEAKGGSGAVRGGRTTGEVDRRPREPVTILSPGDNVYVEFQNATDLPEDVSARFKFVELPEEIVAGLDEPSYNE